MFVGERITESGLIRAGLTQPPSPAVRPRHPPALLSFSRVFPVSKEMCVHSGAGRAAQAEREVPEELPGGGVLHRSGSALNHKPCTRENLTFSPEPAQALRPKPRTYHPDLKRRITSNPDLGPENTHTRVSGSAQLI